MVKSLSTPWRDEGGSIGTAPLILNLCTRWRWVVKFTPWEGTLVIQGEVGPRADLDTLKKIKIYFPYRNSSAHCLACGVVGIVRSFLYILFPAAVRPSASSVGVKFPVTRQHCNCYSLLHSGKKLPYPVSSQSRFWLVCFGGGLPEICCGWSFG